ncbi:GPW/gp25 family protein [Segetibacter aerophilus]|uniref:Baseplate protein n=1 Tax=Segetibacter aerophilus TaxID=670293 RepID=A0A512BIY8_9BACT|nr:GPW/gp25 family protein [Segetibacter aerophilus]GEO11930.1 baseplate protein [Segetibacter aerophilus]
MNDNLQFIGTGWSFPPAFDKATGNTAMTTGVEDIFGSLHILFSTTLGERVMRPEYGCNLKDYVFDPANTAMEAYIKKLVEDAIIYFEPRITLEKVGVDFQNLEGIMWIKIDFRIDATNSRANYVYPYYLKEGTNI